MMHLKHLKPATATRVSLDYQDYTELPEELRHFKKLKFLSFYNNNITKLPDWLFEFEELEELVISVNPISEIPEAIGQLKNLKKLKISNLSISSLPDGLGELKRLDTLSCSSNQYLKHLPESFGEMRKLRDLHIGLNKLTQLPESFIKLQNLKLLDISYNKWDKENPLEKIFQLKKLMQLRAYSCQLESVPESIGTLKLLETFIVNNNKIQALPEVIGELRNLGILEISNNALKTIPESIGKLRQLHRLDINQNKISTLPETLGDCQRLKLIFATNNTISAFPAKLPEAVEILDLSNNSIKTVVNSFKDTNLKELILTNNLINSLPEEMSSKNKLNKLILKQNQLDTLPENLDGWSNLWELDLRNNKFTSFPLELLRMPSVSRMIYRVERFNVGKFLNITDKKKMIQLIDAFNLHKIDYPTRVLFYEMAFKRPLTSTPSIPTLFKALEFSEVTLKDHAIRLILESTEERLKNKPLGKNAVIGYLKALKNFKVRALNKDLKAFDMKIQKGVKKDTSHFIIAPKMEQAIIDAAPIWITEGHIKNFLNEQRKEELFLLDDSSSEGQQNHENLGALLQSGNADSIAVAVELMETGGLTNNLFNEVFLAYHSIEDLAIRKRIRTLIYPYISETDKKALRFFKFYPENMYDNTIRRNLRKHVAPCKHFDATKLASIMYSRYKVGYLYILDEADKETQTAFLQNFIQGTTFKATGLKELLRIPTGLEAFPELECLDFTDCDFAKFPKELFEMKLPKLKRIIFNKNHIWSLPSYFTKLPETIEELAFQSCGFQDFPKVLLKQTYPNLKKIDFRECRYLQEIPAKAAKTLPNCEILVTPKTPKN